MRFDNNIKKYREEIINHQINKYNEQKTKVNLPELNKDTTKLLKENINHLLDKGKGMVTLDKNNIKGYLIGYKIEEMWGSPSIYIPIYGHGIISGDVSKTYQKMYEKNSKTWVDKGYKQHAVTIYSKETNPVNIWFWLGFGLRCVDGIKEVNKKTEDNKNIIKITNENIYKLKNIHEDHTKYYGKAPLFMIRNKDDNPIETLKKWLKEENHHIFAYCQGEKVLGYMGIEEKGEQFLTTDSKMMNITSAYIEPNYRGKKIGYKLLNHVENWLSEKGYERLGVDFESFNIYGSNFWRKHFKMYTYSMVRRIDGN